MLEGIHVHFQCVAAMLCCSLDLAEDVCSCKNCIPVFHCVSSWAVLSLALPLVLMHTCVIVLKFARVGNRCAPC